MQLAQLIEPHSVEILHACCSMKLPVTVVVPESGVSARGRFLSVSDDKVVIESPATAGVQIGVLAQCLVIFVNEGQIYVFVSVLQCAEVGRGMENPKLTLTKPAYVLRPESRRWFRIPVLDRESVEVKFETEGYEYGDPTLLDLSVGGMLLEFQDDQDPGISPDTPVRIELQMEDKVVQYVAEVRYAHDHRYGLMFVPDADAEEAANAEGILREILTKLGSMWSSHRT
ncbi:MAG: hypothetical protein AMXMBFR4_34450 [Candidatus Hydrogenedentota bacterium]